MMDNQTKRANIIALIVIIILSSVTVVSATITIITSSDVIYDNTTSGGSSKTVQGSIDELYKKAEILSEEKEKAQSPEPEMDKVYKDEILNGADPVLKGGMIPVTIDGGGAVKYASLNSKWYSYKEKEWANAVILVDNPSKNYKKGDTINPDDIESYFVWIPRYRYKIWDLGLYTSTYSLGDLTDDWNSDTSVGHITGNARLIDIVFETKDNPTKDGVDNECTTPLNAGDSGHCNVGDYMTHPAFINFDVNGFWVGKFEMGYENNQIIVKPNVTSWRFQTVGTFFNTAYSYNRDLDSHMMKNTEWGAVAYLSHSAYGKGSEININNNENYLTGYSAAAGTDQSTYPGTYETTSDKTQPYNTATGYLASTTGNITGIYDMSGGAFEYLAAYMDNIVGSSGLTVDFINSHKKYFDIYPSDSDINTYNKRILGDATGEMGPFYYYYDGDNEKRYHNAWYVDSSYFVFSSHPWVDRGSNYSFGVLAGQFYFNRNTGGLGSDFGSRLVLAFNN